MEIDKKYLVPYITAGFPDKNKFLKYLELLSNYGDMIEIGIPFSDPLADGSDLQIAHEIGIREEIDIDFIFSMIKKVKNKKPFIIMSYLNPILNYGFEKLLKNSSKNYIKGIVIPDLPLEELKEFIPLFKKYKVHFIPLATPSTPVERFLRIEKIATFFIYFVSVKGTTGGRERLPEYTYKKLKEFRKLTGKRIFLGFGIKNPENVKKILKFVDGIIIGSEIARRILKGENITQFLKEHLKVLKGGFEDGGWMVDKGCKGGDKGAKR